MHLSIEASRHREKLPEELEKGASHLHESWLLPGSENIYAYQRSAYLLLKGSLGKFIHFKALKPTFSLGGDMGTPFLATLGSERDHPAPRVLSLGG